MRYHVLACDYDGTLALHGKVDAPTLAALERVLVTGRKLILVTGRELDELLGIFPEVQLFLSIVAENGALLYDPVTREEKLLCKAPPPEFVETLRKKGVAPISVGRAIVATWRPYESKVFETIRDHGLDLQVIFNKDAVMVLPSGVNKATGLAAALDARGFSPHEVVGIGDAENDHAFLSLGECAVAVDNALPVLKERADLVTKGDHGAGVAELVDLLVKEDLASLEPGLRRHNLLLGGTPDGKEIHLPPYGVNVLIAGPSGSGKSTAATGLLERLAEHKYQFCIIDPEGDYENMEGTVTLGSGAHGPTVDEVLQMLALSQENIVVNLIGVPLRDRPTFFLSLLPRLQESRARTGRPHWLVVDEAHHLLPASWEPGALVFPHDLKQTLFLTVHPDQVAKAALSTVDVVIAVGQMPQSTIGAFYKARGDKLPSVHPLELDSGEVFLWCTKDRKSQRVRLAPSRTERHRHIRKYAEGELPPERSFYFRVAEGKLNLRAQNLILFMQIANGVDDETWMHHLRQGDYSGWFREMIKDEEMADEAAEIEQRPDISAADSRREICAVIERRYTLPAAPPLPMPGTDDAPRRQ